MFNLNNLPPGCTYTPPDASKRHLPMVSSPSDLKGGKECRRKRAFKKIYGLRTPPTKGHIFGTRLHSEVEGYFKEGRPLNQTTAWGRLADQGKKFWPKQDDPSVVVEGRADATIDGTEIVMYKDLVWSRSNMWCVGDHKTTSDLKYQMNDLELLEDIQAVLYGYDEMAGPGRSDRVVGLHWWYYERPYGDRRGRVAETAVYLTREHAEAFIGDTVIPLLETLREDWRNADPEDFRSVPPNWSACEGYGGCAFKALCMPEQTPREAIRKAMSGQPNAVPPTQSKWALAKQAKLGITPPTTPAATPTPPTPPKPSTTQAAPTTPAAGSSLASRFKQDIAARTAAAQGVANVPVNPPEGETAEAQAEAERVIAEAEAERAAAQGGASIPAADQPKRGPGRPPKGTTRTTVAKPSEMTTAAGDYTEADYAEIGRATVLLATLFRS